MAELFVNLQNRHKGLLRHFDVANRLHAGDEGTWLDDAFSEQAPVRRKMSGKTKAAIIVAIIVALVLLVLLGVESMNALGAFLSVAATN